MLIRLLQIVSGALVVALLLVVTAGIVSRALNEPLIWTDEISGFLMVWLACAGWVLATVNGSHIRVRLLHEKMPPGLWRAADASFQIAAILLGGLIAWKSIALIEANRDIEAVSLPISSAWMYAPLLPAGLASALQALAEISRPRRGETAEVVE